MLLNTSSELLEMTFDSRPSGSNIGSIGVSRNIIVRIDGYGQLYKKNGTMKQLQWAYYLGLQHLYLVIIKHDYDLLAAIEMNGASTIHLFMNNLLSIDIT